MPVLVVKDGPGPGTQVPSQLQRIPIPLLSPTSDCTGKTVKVCLGQVKPFRYASFLISP